MKADVSALALLVLLPAALAHLAYEQEFMSLIDPVAIEQDLRTYTRHAHQAGTPGDLDTATFTLHALAAARLNATQQMFRALLPFPRSASVRTVGGAFSYVAKLAEDIVAEDPTSDTVFRNLTFGGYTPSGDAAGELVYVNYGAIEDFEWLRDSGVPLAGRIGVARYGGIFRGLKARHAQQFGLAGLLVYSDPADDGFTRGDTFPNGPWRPTSGVQRGSYSFLSLCAGDPGMIDRDADICGPGVKPADLMPSIPTQPLAYGDAEPLLRLITGGPAPPAAWKGGLPVSYAIGPGPVRVSMSIRNEQKVLPLYNVLATIPGAHPDPAVARQLVIVGNHRDAWVFGSVDPNSGSACLLAVARALGTVMAHGWRPMRTIASWDGEEQGLIGSTYYGENAAPLLSRDAVAYLNLDAAVSGSDLIASASPSLAGFIRDTSKDVTDPKTKRSLYSAWGLQNTSRAVGRLGSGSDFTVMLDYLGIASMDLAFEGDYGVYHSIYDSFAWMKKFGDPNFLYHGAMSQLLGVLTMRLATARVLPLNAADYGAALVEYAAEAAQLAESKQLRQSLSGEFDSFGRAVAQFLVSSQWLEQQRLDALAAVASSASSAAAASPSASATTDGRGSRVFELNERLRLLERQFLDPAGLPGRPYFKHMLVAPGLNTGYAAEVLPSLKQALRDGDATAASAELKRLTALINKAALWTAQPLPLPDQDDDRGHGMDRRTKVALAIGATVVFIVLVLLLWRVWKRAIQPQTYTNLEGATVTAAVPGQTPIAGHEETEMAGGASTVV